MKKIHLDTMCGQDFHNITLPSDIHNFIGNDECPVWMHVMQKAALAQYYHFMQHCYCLLFSLLHKTCDEHSLFIMQNRKLRQLMSLHQCGVDWWL